MIDLLMTSLIHFSRRELKNYFFKIFTYRLDTLKDVLMSNLQFFEITSFSKLISFNGY